MDASPNDRSQPELLARVRDGDEGALDELLRLHRPRLMNQARAELGARLGARVRPSDLVQSTLLEAVQGLDKFRGHNQEAFGTWISRILKNNLRDRARFHRRERRDVGREISGLDLVELARRSSPTPSAEYASAEELQRLSEAMSRLSNNHRRVLVLRMVDQHSHEEIAEILDITPVASRQLLARARAALMMEMARKPLGDRPVE